MIKAKQRTPKKEKIIPANSKTTSFPIVCVGGSAGGLEAFEELLKNLSDKTGMAFVFIMHLSPDHKSVLSELLARVTKMPVSEVKNGMILEANRVYVIPPNMNMSIAGGKLVLQNMKETGLLHMPIDCFFRSLAEERGNRAIGVILSGTATDGTLGAEAIKAEGGITFAQDDKSAKYDGMPKSAIAAGCIDFVLSPKKVAKELERIARHPLISPTIPVEKNKSNILEDKGFESVFDLLARTKGLDFSHYKTSTIVRRMQRRMVLLKLEKLKDYVKYLSDHKDEVENLYEDLLINVTSFFRDPKVFDTLKKKILPVILKNKTKGEAIRIWVPGCSSGEEAYSIAICLLELLGTKASAVPVQIFATDVSENSIHKARRGLYTKNIKENVSPERIKRFFIQTGNSYKVSKTLREMCVFSKQNVFNDPPFSNLDLISCRNTLIYFQPILQKKVFHNFHYALRPDGFLLLGSSESIGEHSNFFNTMDRKQRIFIKKYHLVRQKLELSQQDERPKKLEVRGKAPLYKTKERDLERTIERIVLGEYASCGVLIDSHMEVIQFRGHTGRYLESAAGKPSLDLFKLAREGLLLPLRWAIFKARETKRTAKREAQNVLYNGRRIGVYITVIPMKPEDLKGEFFLVLFDEMEKAVLSKEFPNARGKWPKEDQYIKSLQKELTETKEYLRTVIEEQGSANEEIKTANEEILSSNEELQSTNEELETSKEELQSSNEELVTTNEELHQRNAEVALLNNDLMNFLSSINIPVVMLGIDLVIRRITPQAEKALNIISSDIGRPIHKIKLNVDIPDLEKILSDVIATLHSKTFEIMDREKNWYLINIRPYRTMDNKIDGVVAAFIDITKNKEAQQKVEEACAYAENIIKTMREPLIVLSEDLKVVTANESFYRTFKVAPRQTQGQFIYDLGNGQWNIPQLRKLVEEILPERKTIDNYEMEHDFETIGKKTMILNARCLTDRKKILITFDDITERKKLQEALLRTKTEESFRSVFDQAGDGILLADMETKKFHMGNPAICRMLGYSLEEIKNLGVMDIHPEKDLSYVIEQFERQSKGDFSLARELPLRRRDGSVFYADVNATVVAFGGKSYLMGFFHDNTERRKAENDLRESEDRYRNLYMASHDAIMTIEAPSWKFTAANPATIKVFEAQNEKDFLTYTPWTLSPKMQPDGRSSEEKAKEMIGIAMREGSHFFEWVHRRVSGEDFFADVMLSRVEQGGKTFLHAVVRDLTEQKKVEEEKRRALELKAVSEAKGAFASIVSHELRTPLSTIQGCINVVMEGMTGITSDKQKEFMNTAKRSADRLARLIDNVLDFQKMDFGKMEFLMEEDDLNEVVREVLKNLELLKKGKSLDLIAHLDEALPKIKFDNDSIIQVLTNLVSNAIQQTEKGSITVVTRREDNAVHVLVQDTGYGIESKNMPKLFRAFEPLDVPRDRTKRGTGLGLAISKEIILAHNGKIWAESEFGKGTTLHFTLPIKERRD